jgi:putative transposase
MVWTVETRKETGALGCGGRLRDEEWRLLEPLVPPAKHGGRRRTADLRAVLDGAFHVLRTGCQWRHLPAGFPPWSTVYGYFRRFAECGAWDEMLTVLRIAEREASGREASPSAAIIDSQSVKTTEKGGREAGMEARR